MQRVYIFLLLFSVVLFLEAIGGTYMVSAVQSIERQFQIPSKLSGFMVSAGDFGYIPTVMFIAYFGSKGNRAKWIGGGTILAALSYMLIASPNFIFPVTQPKLNLTAVETRITPSATLLLSNASIADYMIYAPIYDRIPLIMREKLLEHFGEQHRIGRIQRDFFDNAVNTSKKIGHHDNLYLVDGAILSKIVDQVDSILRGNGGDGELRELLATYVHNRLNHSDIDVANMKRSAIAPFSFCSKLINELRQILKNAKCDRSVSNFGPFVVMFTALVLLGIGRTMPWSLGVPMIDDNVKRKSLPAYFAGISFIRILGPIAGFLIGSFCNKLYYTLTTPPGLTAKDPTWIGAWWLGFLIVSILLIVPSCALFFFPSKPRRTKVVPKNGTSAEQMNGTLTVLKPERELSFFDKHKEDEKNLTAEEKFRAFRESYTEVIKSKVYRGAVISRVLDSLAFRGYMVFLPKYLENHYGIPQYKAHQLMAMFGVFGFALGTASGGIITRRFRLNGRCAALFVFVVSTINLCLFAVKIFLGCQSVVNTVGLNGMVTNFNYTVPCNADCGCESAPLFPICNSNGYAYYSPCHAGCREVILNNADAYHLEFASCDCSPGEVLKKELCNDDCKMMIIAFFICVIVGAFAAGNGLVPGMLILLRSVPPAHRSISLGLQGFLVSLLATLPSPLLWGTIFDSACLVWNQTCSNGSGSCAIYDPVALRIRTHVAYVAIRSSAVLIDLYVAYHASNINILEEEEEPDNAERRESLVLEPLPNAL
uniref:Solute carrier organic anion transporter family member n=1 Tax=Ascaris lumbricoides TaxID=6252 RepID=A0A0M3HXB5_ASCLU